MSVKSTALTTLAHFKTHQGISTNTDDLLIEQLIDSVSDWIETQTERKLKRREYNNGGSIHPTTGVADEDYIYFNGSTKDRGGDTVKDESGYGLFYLPAWPVAANDDNVTFTLATLSNRGQSVSGYESWDTDDLEEWDDYIVDRDNGVLRLLGGPFGSGYRNYRVTMAAGYQTGSVQPYVPDDLEELCIRLVAQMYDNKVNVTSEKIGTWSRSFGSAKEDPFVEMTLAKYSRISL